MCSTQSYYVRNIIWLFNNYIFVKSLIKKTKSKYLNKSQIIKRIIKCLSWETDKH